MRADFVGGDSLSERVRVRVPTEIYTASESIRLQTGITTSTESNKLFWLTMTEKFDLRLIPKFSGMVWVTCV